MKEKFERYRKEIEEYLKKNDPEIKQEFKFEKYLTDNRDLINAVIEASEETGSRTLLVAPCGAGKTYTFCSEIARAEEGKRQVVLLVPNRIQAEQNSVYGYVEKNGTAGHVIPVTAGTGQDFQYDCKQAISAVYDSAHRMLNADPENLAKTVLVIDEAHQLVGAKSYRLPCITTMEKVARRVIRAGGSVIYMTGTERKIRSLYYDRLIECEPVSGGGIQADHIEFFEKKSHSMNMRELTFNYIVKKNEAGYRPLVRLNNKNAIEIIATKLRANGLNVYTLSSDDKAYSVDADTKERVYDSPVYQSIMEETVLPEADAYLTTSILEVGTSIVGIRNEDGTIEQPQNMLPTFVCQNPGDFDIDDMIQFFARLRFKYEHAAVLVPSPSRKKTDEDEDLSYAGVLNGVYELAAERCEAFNKAENGREDYIDMSGNSEKHCIKQGTDGLFEVDIPEVIAQSYGDYFSRAYLLRDCTAKILREEMKVDIVTIDENDDLDVLDKMKPTGKPVPEDVKEGLRAAVKKTYFKQALTKAKGIDGSDKDVKALRRMNPDSFKVMKKARELMVSDSLLPEAAVDLAIRQTENPDVRFPDAGSGRVIPYAEVAKRGVFNMMASWSHQKVMRIVSTWNALHEREYDSRFASDAYSKVITDDRELFSFNAVAETKKMEYLIEIYNWFQTHKKWKELCGFFSRHDEKDCASYMRMHQCVELNRHTPATTTYNQQVAFRKTLLGAEYNALRCPEMWFHEVLENGEFSKTKMFPNGILNKKLTGKELLIMARQMTAVVRRQCPQIRKNYNYSAPGIADMLNCIYKCRYVRSGKQIVITALELRKNISTNVSGEKLSDESVISICDRSIAECRYLSGSERKRTLEQITKSLKKVLDPIAMERVEHHLREWIGICENTRGGAVVTATGYQEGTLQAIVEGRELIKAG